MSSYINQNNILEWKKDLNSVYLEANQTCAQIFGFQKADHMIGCTDYDIPSKLSDFSDTFRNHDKIVIETRKTIRILEIQPCANDIWRIFLVTKSPLYTSMREICGTSAYSVDVTVLFEKMPHMIEHFYHLKKNDFNSESLFIDEHTSDIHLTKRQADCLFFLIRGKSIKQIAKIFRLSPRTVEHYIEAIKIKFNCVNKSDLIEQAFKFGYINIIPKSFFRKQTSIIIEEIL